MSTDTVARLVSRGEGGKNTGGVTAVGCPGWDEEEEEEVEKARSVQVRR